MQIIKKQPLGKAIALISLAAMGSTANAAQLEEVVVTAQKRTESMQDVPIAVSAVTGEQFAQTQAFTLEGLSATIPNVQIGHFANTPHNAVFNIRGVGAPIEPDPYAGTTVSIVVDGVPQYFNMMALLDLFDVERIEVLKGPQGTLFGANTTGGVVNVVTKKPTGEYGGEANINIGNYNRLDGNVAVDFPISETLAGKVAFTHHGQDGFYTNVYTGDSQGDIDTNGLRTYLRYMGSETFDATLSFEYIRSNNGSPAIVNGASPGELQDSLVARGEIYGDAALPMYESPCPAIDQRCSAPDEYYSANNQVPDQSNFESRFLVLNMNWSTDIGDITSITAYKSFDLKEYTDQDFTPATGSATYRPTSGNQLSQEIRGNFEFSEDLTVQAGGYYMATEYTHVQNYWMNQFFTGLRQVTTNKGDNWSASMFAQAYYDISDKLRLQAGIRYTHEKTELDVAVNNFVNWTFDDQGNITGQAQTVWRNDTPAPAFGDMTSFGSESWDEIGGKIGLDYTVDDDMMLYGFYARGFKSGGFVGRITIPQDIGPYDPEYVDSFELGMKSEFMDKSIRLNAAAFYNKYTDQQIASIYRYTDANTGVSLNGNSILNAAKSTIYGFELEMLAVPTDNLTLNASLAYLSAEYDEFDYLELDGSITDLSGERLQNAPEWGGSASATYEIPVGPGTMSSTLSYRYSDSKYYTAIKNTPRSEVQATSFIDANIDWTPNDDRWTASLWVRNLTDKRYIAVAYDSPGYAALVGYHNPREVGASLKFRF